MDETGLCRFSLTHGCMVRRGSQQGKVKLVHEKSVKRCFYETWKGGMPLHGGSLDLAMATYSPGCDAEQEETR